MKPGTQVHVLDPAKNEITQINQVLANCNQITSLTLIAYGSEASLQLGGIKLNFMPICGKLAGLVKGISTASDDLTGSVAADSNANSCIR
jgi:hypothetical protein